MEEWSAQAIRRTGPPESAPPYVTRPDGYVTSPTLWSSNVGTRIAGRMWRMSIRRSIRDERPHRGGTRAHSEQRGPTIARIVRRLSCCHARDEAKGCRPIRVASEIDPRPALRSAVAQGRPAF